MGGGVTRRGVTYDYFLLFYRMFSRCAFLLCSCLSVMLGTNFQIHCDFLCRSHPIPLPETPWGRFWGRWFSKKSESTIANPPSVPLQELIQETSGDHNCYQYVLVLGSHLCVLAGVCAFLGWRRRVCLPRPPLEALPRQKHFFWPDLCAAIISFGGPLRPLLTCKLMGALCCTVVLLAFSQLSAFMMTIIIMGHYIAL